MTMTTATLRVAVDTKQVKAADTDLDGLASAAKKTDAAVKGMGATASRANARIGSTGAAASAARTQINGASGSVANLTAQFNDIGVMLAAGQNPLQLAMQQGTQVNQVFAQMGGGANAVRGLGAAFLSMISPLNLATLGIIAGGAALTQWALSSDEAEEGALTLKDAIAELKNEARDAKDQLDIMLKGFDNVAQLTVANEIAALEQQIAAAREAQAFVNPNLATMQEGSISALERQLELLRDQMTARNEAVSLSDLILNADKAIADAERDIARNKERSLQTAEEMLASLSRQNSLQATINRFGADSAEVAAMRARNEREVFEEMLATLDVSQDLKDQLTGAFLVSQDLAKTDIAAPIVTAAQAARDLAEKLSVSLGIAWQLKNMTDESRQGVSGPDGAIQQIRGAREDSIVFQRTYPASRKASVGGSRRSGGGGSGGGASGGLSDAAREAQRLDNEMKREAERVISDLRSETEIYNDELRDLQELQKMGYLSTEQMAAATATLTQELQQARWDDTGLGNFIDDLSMAIVTTGKLSDVFRSALQRMAASYLSSGLTNIFQTGFNAIAGGFGGGISIAGARANGGPVSGGSTYLVGERGPELFTPRSSGNITSNEAMQGGGAINVRVIGGDLMLSDGGQIMARVQVMAEQAKQSAVAQVPVAMREYTEVYG